MKRLSAPAIALVFFALACSSSAKTPQVDDSLAGALTRSVKFKNGLIKKGSIGKADAAARNVKLNSIAEALAFGPNDAALMSFDVDNPDQDNNPVAATLMQFDDADSHIEVPAKPSAKSVDGGSDSGNALHIENPFDVDGGICKYLCNRRYTSHMTYAITLDDGLISEHGERDIVLDCRHDGDPKRCTADDPGDAAVQDDGGAKQDAGQTDDAGNGQVNTDAGGHAGSGGTGAADAGDTDAGAAATRPQIGLLTPGNTVAAMDVTLSISGTGFLKGAVVYVDGETMPTTFVSDTAVEAAVAAQYTGDAGSLVVYVENVAGDERTRSNTLYLQVDPAAGAPLVYDYSPDNGVAGDTVLIIASNLAGQTLEITDANGKTLTPDTLSTISWPTAGTVDTVEIVLPDGIETGPITVSNGLGSFKGKIFNVGSNLSRISGTTLDSSTQYNTSNWGRASGGDNLLATSFFTANGDCATATSCTTKPWFSITFPSQQTVSSVAMRGNREYATGYDFLRGTFEVLGANDDVLWEGTYDLPAPDRDLDIVLPAPVKNAISVRFSSLDDESTEPGFAELEVF